MPFPASLRWSVPHPLAAAWRPPLVMGVLNVTPDSFSDGGRFATLDAAIAAAWHIANAGAHILDVGGQSTRPGAEPVPESEELARTEPLLRELARTGYPLPISLDTSRAAVARAGLQAGACIINDVTALRGDPLMAPLVASSGAALVLMHMQGEPRTMQENPAYADVLAEVTAFLRERIDFACAAGITAARIAADPGIGFGKRLHHNIELLRSTSALARALQVPILIGTSRKRFLGELLEGAPVTQRLEGTLASIALAVAQGACIVRVHDVPETVRFLKVFTAICPQTS